MLFTDGLRITPEILGLIAEIDEFKGAWGTTGGLSSDRLTILRRVATIESIGSSTRIEGSKLSDRDVANLLTNLETNALANSDEQAVVGYAEVMERILSSWEKLPPTENHILQLHRDLLAHSEKDAWHRGIYKTSANHVVAFDERGGVIGVVLETSPPHQTPILMTDLMTTIQEDLKSKPLHPLLLIGLWAVRFLEIHPFKDGNGRLSRLFSTLLLLWAGYAYVPYSSLERVIEQNTAAYYLALRKTQETIRTDDPDWQPWLVFFLRSLAEQMNRLKKKIEELKVVFGPLSQLSSRILEFIGEHGRITMSDAIRVTGASRNTLKQHFRVLVRQGKLLPRGQGRGVWYVLQ